MKIALLIGTGLAAHGFFHVLIFMRIKFAFSPKLLLDLAGLVVGLYIADFLISLAHWLGDCPKSWHSHFLKSYRALAHRHHVSPLAILQESFWQIRGNIAWLYLPALLLAWYIADIPFATPGVFLLIALSNGLLLSHTLHKWLHASRQPWLLHVLQSLGIIITRDYHMRHHVAPYDKNFAALNGWADRLFEFLIVRKSRDSVE